MHERVKQGCVPEAPRAQCAMTLDDLVRFSLALAFVLALMALLSFLLKRFGGQGLGIKTGPQQRLHIIETRMIDARHRLVLVRLDTQEHLIVVGPQGQTTITSQPAPLEAAP